MQIDGRIRGMLRGALLFLQPPERTAERRAAAAEQAAEALNLCKRNLLRAGLATGPDCELIEPLSRLQEIIRAEAEGILAVGDFEEAKKGDRECR